MHIRLCNPDITETVSEIDMIYTEIIWSYPKSSCQIQPKYGPYFLRIPLFRLSHRRTRPLAVTHISCDLTAMGDSTGANQIGPPSIQYKTVLTICWINVFLFLEDLQIETLRIHQKFIPTLAFQNWLEQRSTSFLNGHARITTCLHDWFQQYHWSHLNSFGPCSIDVARLVPYLTSVLPYVWMVPPRTRPHILRSIHLMRSCVRSWSLMFA